MLVEIPVDLESVIPQSPRLLSSELARLHEVTTSHSLSTTGKTTTAMAEKKSRPDEFPGFTALSDQIFYWQPEPEPTNGPAADFVKVQGMNGTAATAAAAATESNGGEEEEEEDVEHPTVVLIFGWGDAPAKHVMKYTEGYRKLYPQARQVAVLAPIMATLKADLASRTKSMIPVLQGLFPASSRPGRPVTDEEEEEEEVESKQKKPAPSWHGEERILVHAMSNTGGINYAAALNAYKELYSAPMPHHLCVLDSTPGSPWLSPDTLVRWSRAMALGTAGWFPWPFVVTQGIWAGFLCANRALEIATGRQAASVFSCFAMTDPELARTATPRLYLYSKEDDLIAHTDIELNIEESRRKGYDVEAMLFEGTAHVGHMRKFPERYWGAVRGAWAKGLQEKNSILVSC